MNTELPAAFSELERFIAWARPTSAERNRHRLASPIEELRSFYDAMVPRLEQTLMYLDRFSLHEMPQDALRLMYLALALAEVSIAVELFGEPNVTGGCDPARFVVVRELNP